MDMKKLALSFYKQKISSNISKQYGRKVNIKFEPLCTTDNFVEKLDRVSEKEDTDLPIGLDKNNR